MRITVQSSKGSDGEEFLRDLSARAESSLSRSGGQIINLDILLMDDDTASDKGCLMEARMSSSEPIVVQAHADTIEQAVTKGADKIERMLEDRLNDRGAAAELEFPSGY